MWEYYCVYAGNPGPDEYVPAGDPGGGDDTALVLSGSKYRQKQTASQKPGGRCCTNMAPRGDVLKHPFKNGTALYSTPVFLCMLFNHNIHTRPPCECAEVEVLTAGQPSAAS